MKPRLTMLIGLDGAGRDECAGAMGGVVAAEMEEAARLLAAGENVVLNAPNLRCRTRRAFLERLSRTPCARRAVLVASPLADCLRAAPERAEAIREQVLSFYPPQPYEGFDEVEVYYPRDFRRTDLGELFFGKEGLVFLPQDNPFHDHSLGVHCIRAAREAARLRPQDPALWLAALLHDIGKAGTKAFVDSHGRPSATAHYYGHEFASAYESLFVRFPAAVPERERLRVSALIVWHMMPFHFSNEKTRARYLRLWGEQFFDDMAVIERADQAAQRV
jgi:hypothetical protein